MMAKKEETKEKKRRFGKDFWITAAICLAIGAALSGIVGGIEATNPLNKSALGIAFDSLGIAGLLLLFAYILQWVASYGLFDVLAYGVQVFVFTIFRPGFRKSGFPATFLEYKEEKNRKERKPLLAICVVAGIFILASLIVYICYKTIG